MNKYELIKIIGDGTYGIVYEGRNKDTKEKVAVKKLKERFVSLEECLERKEVRILGQLKHENIVQLKEVIREKSGEVSYIFEYCDCNLLEFIEKHRKIQKLIPESIIRDIILQITKGIKYMHSNQFFHRDLKPENILVILNNYDFNSVNNNGQLRIKIADFGTAKEIPLRNNLPMTDYVCTRWYRAPECVLRTDFYNEKVDIWAIGCIMSELYRLSPIFPGEDEFDQIHQMLKILGTPTRGKWPWGYYQTDLLGIQFPVYYKKDFKKILQYISKEGVNLLNEIFQFEFSMRPTCSKILSHPYFKINERSLLQSNIRSLNRRNLYLNQKTDNDKRKNNNINNRIYKNKINNNNIIFNNINGMANNSKINNGNKIIKRNKNYYEAESINIYKNNINTRSYVENNRKGKNSINNNRQRTNRILYISNYSSNKNIKDNYNSNNITKNVSMISTIRRKISNDNSNYIYRNLNNINNSFINCDSNYNNVNNLRKIDTDKKIRNNKYKTINKIKSDMVNKRILRFSKNLKEESKDNEINCYKKELNSNKNGSIYKNEDNFSAYSNNYKSKYSYIPLDREENKEDSKNKSIENGHNQRFIHFSSDKYERPKRVIQNRKVKEIKRYNEFESDYNNLSSDGNEYNKYNSYKKTNKKNIHFEDNLEKKNGNNNIIFRRNHKNINRDNHRFYVSNACRINYRNNDNYYSYNGYNNCKCSFLRNNSVRRNVINNNKDRGYYATNTHKIRNLGDYYMNNNSSTPRAHYNIKKENNNALSPIRRNEQNNFLYSSFIISKINHKMLFGKSQYSFRNNTIRNFNPNNYFIKADDNNCKSQIKVVNINLTDLENHNNNFIICSSSKKRNSLKTVY